MGFSFNLIVVCAAWSLCGAYRTSSIGAIQSKQTAVCARKAVASKANIDVRSLSFDNPDFTFFESRSFFLSKFSSCEIRMPEVKLQMVPTTAEGKLALLEQRLKVKHLKDGLRSVVKADVGSLQGIQNLAKGASGDQKVVPAVELHMFPIDPMNVSSTWQVLLVPTVQEVFGERLYLCNPNSVDPCVAELPFEDLPWRLLRVFSRKWWDPVLDRRRSTPMLLVWIAEFLLLCAGCLAFSAAAAAVYKFIDGLLTTEEDPDPYREAILEDQKKLPSLLPYQLLKHAYVYRRPGGAELAEPKVCKDAGDEVLVDMIESASQTISCQNISFEILWEGIRRIYARPREALWGRLQKDDAWILLHKEKEKWPFVIAAGKKPLAQFEAAPDLLPQYGRWARRILLLFASYTTALWVSVDHLTELCSVPVLVCLLLGMFLIHGTVLLEEIHAWWVALSYDEVLQVRRELLRLPGVNILSASVCGLLCGMVFVGLLVKLPTAERSQRPAFLLLLVSAALHARHFYMTMVSRRLWREPKLLNKESFYVELDTLSSTSTWPTRLSIQRAKTYFLVASLVALALSAAAMVVSFAALDILEMRGELLDYSFSRGHLTSPANTFSFHNTVLLDDKTDSLTLNFEKGNHTNGLFLQVENPLLDNGTETFPVHQFTEHPISLPSSPFYSRISLIAVGSYINTTYIFHILRLGAAINVSLQSFFGAKHPELQSTSFSEERRVQYLSEHAKWYIPDVDVDMDSIIEVKMEPISLAPLRASRDTHLPQVSNNCHCEKTVPGEGNRCVFQKVMNMSGEQICVYQRQLQRFEPDLTDAGVAGQDFEAVQWLKDVDSSGKSVALGFPGSRIGFTPNHDGTGHNSTFTLTAPFTVMANAVQLLVTTTPDPTDTETVVIPLEFVFHAPPVSLRLPSSSNNFLVPNNEQDSQGLYAWCGGDEVDTVTGEVEDLRFQVEANIIQDEQSCTGLHTDSRKEFRVYYNKTNPYCGSRCHTYPYIPRYNDYDLAVTWSARECLHKAVVYDNVTALDHTIKTMAPGDPEAKKCLDEGGLLRVAIRRGQHNFAQRVIEKGANLSAVTEGETPLIAASVLGDIAGVELLLNVNDSSRRRQIDLRVEGETALSTAILYCHADVVGALLDAGSSVTGETCDEVPLVGLLSFPKLVKCNGSQFQEVLQEFKRHDATSLNATVDGDCRGDALRDSAENKDLAAMKFVLEQGVNMSEGWEIPVVRSVVQKSLDDQWPQSDVKSVLGLMKEYKADLNKVVEPPTLIQVANECDVKLFQTLQKLGANASATWYGDNPTIAAQRNCEKKFCTNDTCPEEYIGQPVSQAIANLAQQ